LSSIYTGLVASGWLSENIRQLEAALHREWQQLSQQDIRRLTGGMRCGVEAVNQAREGYIRVVYGGSSVSSCGGSSPEVASPEVTSPEVRSPEVRSPEVRSPEPEIHLTLSQLVTADCTIQEGKMV
jgi:hypothetical protein